MQARVLAVARSDLHGFSKSKVDEIELIAGLGVRGDAHSGVTVKHRSRVAKDPSQPNLRQVHLIHSELFAEVAQIGFDVQAGDLGENVTTEGIDLLGLPRGAILHIGATVRLEVTGLRNPCAQIEAFQTGLLSAVLGKDAEGRLIRKAGVMAIVLQGGRIRPEDLIEIELPAPPYLPLGPV
jgi:MOSC domain-containing protein YiiM